MKKIATAVALSLIGAAMAAPAWADPGTPWSGLYVGVNAGVGSMHARFNTTTVYSSTGYFATTSVPAVGAVGVQGAEKTGALGGVTIGYNWQLDNTVLGVESDFDATSSSASTSGTAGYPCCAGTGFTVRSSASSDWEYTLRGRLGMLVSPNALLYGTAGLAVADERGSFLFTDTFATAHESASVSDTRLGYVIGGGTEFALKGGWSLKAEYLYSSFGRVNTTSTNLTAYTPVIAFPQSPFSHSVAMFSSSFRVGLNYKFH